MSDIDRVKKMFTKRLLNDLKYAAASPGTGIQINSKEAQAIIEMYYLLDDRNLS